MDKDKLLAEIKNFVSETGMSEIAFGAKAVNNGHLVARLRGGGGIELDTVGRITAFMAKFRAEMAVNKSEHEAAQ